MRRRCECFRTSERRDGLARSTDSGGAGRTMGPQLSNNRLRRQLEKVKLERIRVARKVLYSLRSNPLQPVARERRKAEEPNSK